MANEIRYSAMGNLRLAEILKQEIVLALADRASIRNSDSLVYLGDMNNRGSTVMKVPIVGLDGYDELASVAENAAVSNTALTNSTASVTIGRYAKQYQYTDLFKLTSSLQPGTMDPVGLAADAVRSADLTLTSLVATVASGFGTSVGSSGVDLSLDNFYSAIYQLEANSVPGPYLCMLHPVQFADFQNSLRSEAGAISYMPATQDKLRLKGPGFKGEFAGVEIFVSSRVPTANVNADRAGGMWGRGAIGWADASAPAPMSNEFISAGNIMVEFSRDAAGAMTSATTNAFLGAIKVEDGRGVSIITDNA